MSDLFSLFDRTEQADIAVLLKPATHDDPLPPLWPANGIAPHPYASINRMMTADEARELRASIDAEGLHERIVIFEGKILDGRNRYLECVALGRFPAKVDWRTHPDFIEFCGKGWDNDRGTDPLAFVWSMEVRRHMSAKDMALRAARYLRFIAVLVPEFPDGKTAKLRLPSQADLAKRHGISERLVNSAMVLLDRAEPEVIAAVEQGTLALTDAADVVSKLDKIEQRIIAENPDRKSTKKAVQAAKPKARPLPPAPELPSPVSRADLANFAESVIGEAHRLASKHGGKGASMSADYVLNIARSLMLIERGDTFSFSRPMLLVLGKLRDLEAAPRVAPEGSKHASPTEPAMGGEWSIKVGGNKAKHDASIAIFHEEDETFSISVNYDFGVRSGSEPFHGSYAGFNTALAVAASSINRVLDGLAGATDSVTPAATKKSAEELRTWMDRRCAEWGVVPSEPEPSNAERPELDAYVAALKAGAEHHGKHTQATAKPIILAAEAARISIGEVSTDIGHPRGTIGGWRHKLGLQKADRNPALGTHGAEAHA